MEEKIEISKALYDELLETQRWVGCLNAAGVDNWGGIEMAQEMYDEKFGDN